MTEVRDTDELRNKVDKIMDVCLPCINMKLDAIIKSINSLEHTTYKHKKFGIKVNSPQVALPYDPISPITAEHLENLERQSDCENQLVTDVVEYEGQSPTEQSLEPGSETSASQQPPLAVRTCEQPLQPGSVMSASHQSPWTMTGCKQESDMSASQQPQSTTRRCKQPIQPGSEMSASQQPPSAVTTCE